MPGKRRFSSQEQATTISTFSQTNFGGGLNSDLPASEIGSTELSVADNVLCYPHDIRGRSGSFKFNPESLPGSGTIHNLVNHTENLYWLLHRGSQLWRGEPDMAGGWDELTLTGSGGSSFGRNEQSMVVQNKGDYVIGTYGGIFNILFSDTGSNNIVYVANGPSPNVPMPGIGRIQSTKHVYRILYTYVRLTGDTTNGRISGVLEQETGSVNIDNISDKDYGVIYYAEPISSTNFSFLSFEVDFLTASPGPDITLSFENFNTGDAVQVTSTTTLPAPLLASTTYYVISESFGNDIKLATTRKNAFDGTAISMTSDGTGTHTMYSNIVNNIGDHHTHIGVYMTGDLGSGIIDPATNTGFNPEVYVWIEDIPYTSLGDSDPFIQVDTEQEVWTARLAAGSFVLRTRQFSPIPSGNTIHLSGAWFFSTSVSQPTIMYYSQIIDPGAKGISLGYHNIGFQSHRLDDGIKVYIESLDYMVIATSSKTYMVQLKSFNNVGVISSVFQLSPPSLVDESIGISLYSTVAAISKSRFIAVCSDSSVRIFDAPSWGADLSLGKVKDSEIKKILSGAVGAYYEGAYFLWYSKLSVDDKNENTLRLALEKEAGEGWSTYSGTDWIKTPFNVPPVNVIAHNGSAASASGQKLFMAFNFDNNNMYIIETFAGFLEVSDKEYDDKETTPVVCTIKSKEIVGGRESNRKEIQEAHAYIRPQLEADGLPVAFEIIAKDYIDGSVTATETITNIPYTGDIEFFKQAAGARFQVELISNSSEFRIVGFDVDYIEKKRKKLSPTITQTDEYGYQVELSTDLTIWITRYDYTLDRATGVRANDFKTIFDTLGLVKIIGPDNRGCSAIEVGGE